MAQAKPSTKQKPEQTDTNASARSLGSGVSVASNLRELIEANPKWKSVEIGGKVFPNPNLKTK